MKVIWLLLILGACCPLFKKEGGTLSLTETHLQAVKYTGAEKLTFVNNKGETKILQGMGRKSSTEKWVDSRESCEYYMVETNKTKFLSAGFLDVEILLTASDFPVGTPTQYLTCYIYAYGLGMPQTEFSMPIFNAAACSSPTPYFSCLPSLEVEGKVYHTVYKCQTQRSSQINGASNNVKVIYYSVEAGLLRLEIDNGEVWSLKK